MKTQLELQQEILAQTGINIVTCGNCGSTLLHNILEDEITCPDCKFTNDMCNFPDLNY